MKNSKQQRIIQEISMSPFCYLLFFIGQYTHTIKIQNYIFAIVKIFIIIRISPLNQVYPAP